MGDIADDMVNGACCEECGVYFTEEHGYPVLCEACWTEDSTTQKAEHPELGDDEMLEDDLPEDD